MTRTIEVVPYDSNWPALFAIEAKRIQEALGPNCIEIHHIGSTSIPGLSAKPVIDILPVVRNILEVDKANEAMEALGYEARGEYGIAFRRYFQKGGDLRTHHAHVYQQDDPEINRYLKFRDWMRTHSKDAENYAQLKIELAKKFPHDIIAYGNGKDSFIASIDAKDGFDGWRMVKAATNREWEAVRHFRQKYFFKSKEDPYISIFSKPDHVHFVFYKKSEIIGYVHMQLWPDKRAILRILVIEEELRKQGWGSHFLKLCERWLTHQGYQILVMQSTRAAYPFYRQHGYSPFSFQDPEGHETEPLDIEIGKSLTTDLI